MSPRRAVPSKRPTLADLAAKLGLDKSSISLALRGSRKVSPDTRARVVAAARRLGYAPNIAARQLSSTAAQLIGLVLPSDFRALSYEGVLKSIQSLAMQASAGGMVFNIILSEDLVKAAAGDAPYPLMPDGFCVWGDVPAGHAAAIESLGRPVVVLDPSDASYASYAGCTVEIDNGGGGAALVERLLKNGARRLLVVQELPVHRGQTERWQAARARWIKKMPMETLSYCLLEELDEKHLGRFCSPSGGAILCTNDRAALSVWHRLQRAGVSVPGKVRLTGFDGEREAREIGLTTVAPAWDEFGRAAFAMLVERIAGRPRKQNRITVPVALIEGATG